MLLQGLLLARESRCTYNDNKKNSNYYKLLTHYPVFLFLLKYLVCVSILFWTLTRGQTKARGSIGDYQGKSGVHGFEDCRVHSSNELHTTSTYVPYFCI